MNDWPIITPSCIENVCSSLKSGIFSSKNQNYNPENSFQDKFTHRFCEFLNVPYGKLVPNGTIALVVALLAAGVIADDYVLVSENTWISSIGAITLINAIPILVPCKKDNLLIDCNEILKLRKKYKPKAAIIVHLNGLMQDYSQVFEKLRTYNVTIIEDCAQAIGSEFDGIKAGTIGDIGVFSFQESKVLTCGEGGFVCTKSGKTFRNISLYQDLTHAQKVPMLENNLYLFGSNYRVTELNCALLYSQFNDVFLCFMKEKDLWARRIIELLNKQKKVKTINLNTRQNILSLFKIPVIFNSKDEKEMFIKFLVENKMQYYNGVTPLYLTNIFSEGTKKLKKMKYKTKRFDDYDIQVNQVGIFHYYFNEKKFKLLKEYFEGSL